MEEPFWRLAQSGLRSLQTFEAENMNRLALVSRWALAGPLALLAAIVGMAGSAVWVPAGPATVNNIALPLVLFPAYWAIAFFYALMEQNQMRAWFVLSVFIAGNVGFIFNAFTA